SAQENVVDLSKITLSKSLSRNIDFAYIESNDSLHSIYNSIAFANEAPHRNFIPNRFVTKKIVLRFQLQNNTDSALKFWFFPGLYYWDITMYRVSGNQPVKLPAILPKSVNEISYREISIDANCTDTILAELIPVKTHLNRIRPSLIHPNYLPSFVKELDSINNESKIFTYVFCGLLLMMILFSLASYFQGANKEFLYYSGYAFFIGAMLFIKAIESF